MASFHLTVRPGVDCATAWARLWDLAAHDRIIPATRVAPTDPLRAGSRFTAVTGWGPLAVRDEMVVVEFVAPNDGGTPGRAVIEKVGSVLSGRIEVLVGAAGAAGPPGCVVEWRQELRVARLPRAVDPVVAAVGRVAYGRVIAALLAGGAG